MASRFKDLDVSVEDFISEQENESTKKKTLQNVAVLQQFLASKNEERRLEEIPPEELNEYLSEFIITVRTKDKQEEYEPSSLRGFIASFERYLKKKKLRSQHHQRPAIRENKKSFVIQAERFETQRERQ